MKENKWKLEHCERMKRQDTHMTVQNYEHQVKKEWIKQKESKEKRREEKEKKRRQGNVRSKTRYNDKTKKKRTRKER